MSNQQEEVPVKNEVPPELPAHFDLPNYEMQDVSATHGSLTEDPAVLSLTRLIHDRLTKMGEDLVFDMMTTEPYKTYVVVR
jgi:hypothetical protein